MDGEIAETEATVDEIPADNDEEVLPFIVIVRVRVYPAEAVAKLLVLQVIEVLEVVNKVHTVESEKTRETTLPSLRLAGK